MSHTLVPADVSHYYQRLAELSTLPFWQREEFTEPAGPERGHVRHWQDVYPELTRSREIATDAAGLQRRALIRATRGSPLRRPVPPRPSRPPTRCSSPARVPPSTPIPSPPCGSGSRAVAPA
jgi:hypothetical protein